MRARWEGLHAALVRSVMTLSADRHFREVRGREVVLKRFESPSGLLAYLTSKSGSLDEKDAIYAALIRAVHAREAWAEVGKAILWCGLWPALDGIYRHRLRHFKEDPEELVEAISVAFNTLVGRVDLGRVHRVAATLVRSTDRDVMDERRREWARQQHQAEPLEDRDARHPEHPELQVPAPRQSELGLPVGLSFDGELAALRGWLLPISGADTDLLLAVLVLDESQRDAAERMGLTHEAARKRLQRALVRVREQLARALSQFSEPTRVSEARGPESLKARSDEEKDD